MIGGVTAEPISQNDHFCLGDPIMSDVLKDLIAHQYEAALCTLNFCIARCPDDRWNERVANLKFCQAVFHTVFFADYYLQPADDREALKRQAFHLENKEVFRDYEELEDRAQVL